ncbi:MAG: hypothetical protein WC700_09065 [Gemmatimonadaceae bacterium]|jgi:hypothetical protein
MADTLSLQGAVVTTPVVTGAGSGLNQDIVQLNETVALVEKTSAGYTLSVDTAVSVGLGGLTAVHFVQLKASAKIRVRVTSADGTAAAIPVDSLLILINLSVPITAIDLTRVAGQSTTVQVLLGQAS